MLGSDIWGLWTEDLILADAGVKHSISKIISFILFFVIAKWRPENCRNVDSSDFKKVLMESLRFPTQIKRL